jgi:hypothetical protein
VIQSDDAGIGSELEEGALAAHARKMDSMELFYHAPRDRDQHHELLITSPIPPAPGTI